MHNQALLPTYSQAAPYEIKMNLHLSAQNERPIRTPLNDLIPRLHKQFAKIDSTSIKILHPKHIADDQFGVYIFMLVYLSDTLSPMHIADVVI